MNCGIPNVDVNVGNDVDCISWVALATNCDSSRPDEANVKTQFMDSWLWVPRLRQWCASGIEWGCQASSRMKYHCDIDRRSEENVVVPCHYKYGGCHLLAWIMHHSFLMPRRLSHRACEGISFWAGEGRITHSFGGSTSFQFLCDFVRIHCISF